MATTHIGLYGPFGWGNLGDAAIQEAMLHNVRRRIEDVRFTGISLNPVNTRAIHGIDAVPILRSWVEPDKAPEGVGVSVGERGSDGVDGVKAEAAADSAANATTRPDEDAPSTSWKDLAPVLLLRRLLRPAIEALRELRFHARNTAFLRQLDLLVISGGGQISDDWGGPWDHPWSMFMWTLMARSVGTPVAVVSVGAGPIDAPLSRRFFFAALRLASWRSVRDVQSLHFLRDAGCSLPVEVYPDLAFSHPLPASTTTGNNEVVGVVTGMSPMSWQHPTPGVWPDQNAALYDQHIATLAQFTVSLMDAGDRVVLFSNQIRNDRFAFDDLLTRLGERDAFEAEPTRDLQHLLKQIASTDVVVTSRLHGVILSFLQARPVIALSYESKIDAVLEQFGQNGARLSIDAVSAEGLAEHHASLVDDIEATRAHIATVAASHRARLDEQYDRLFGQAGVMQ
ncbi:hypothetical protein DRQ53_11645 [bacterium]|nr:MAG: hypothetical protein DRQ53_11645 [bacterium]